MRAYGAMVVAVENKADRWRLQSAGVREFGWYPTSPFFGPVVGSNPYGMEGYKTIAFEIAEAFDWEVPDWCVLPVCYGDALFGMWKGFERTAGPGLDRSHAAPRRGRGLGLAHGGDGERRADAARPAAQRAPRSPPRSAPARAPCRRLEVLRRSKGVAITIENDEIARWVVTLGAREGIWPEPASAAPFAAIERLRASGIIAPRRARRGAAHGERPEGSRRSIESALPPAAGREGRPAGA